MKLTITSLALAALISGCSESGTETTYKRYNIVNAYEDSRFATQCIFPANHTSGTLNSGDVCLKHYIDIFEALSFDPSSGYKPEAQDFTPFLTLENGTFVRECVDVDYNTLDTFECAWWWSTIDAALNRDEPTPREIL